MNSAFVENKEAEKYLDQVLGVLARIIVRDIMQKQVLNGDVKNDSDNRNIQDE